ncbi:MAG: hypothetical protein GX455_17320 [Phycisphaerae bacterium]|nr:hypothetical protein [Phycisphaerae bacterium]
MRTGFSVAAAVTSTGTAAAGFAAAFGDRGQVGGVADPDGFDSVDFDEATQVPQVRPRNQR